MKIKFTQGRVVQDGLEGTPDETSFEAGQVVDLNERSARHWLDRGVAVEVFEEIVSEVEQTPEQAYPIHKRFGLYELSDGSTVMGKNQAHAAQAELDE